MQRLAISSVHSEKASIFMLFSSRLRSPEPSIHSLERVRIEFQYPLITISEAENGYSNQLETETVPSFHGANEMLAEFEGMKNLYHSKGFFSSIRR